MSILVPPPAIVLAFLWLAVMVLTFVAGVAILFTARYPRAIFDFIVGVMRWTWRVAVDGISVVGTDKYPPFSLQRDPTIPLTSPSTIRSGCPAAGARASGGFRPSRTTSWSPSLPAAGPSCSATTTGRSPGTGLIALLAVIAMVITLLRGRYPDQLFDFIMGMNRWCLRVLAYAALMRDEYSPFRFEPGGPDPAGTARNVAPPLAPDRTATGATSRVKGTGERHGHRHPQLAEGRALRTRTAGTHEMVDDAARRCVRCSRSHGRPRRRPELAASPSRVIVAAG